MREFYEIAISLLRVYISFDKSCRTNIDENTISKQESSSKHFSSKLWMVNNNDTSSQVHQISQYFDFKIFFAKDLENS